MKKLTLLLFVFIIINLLGISQKLEWAKSMGGEGLAGDLGYAITTDALDNTYITGYFSGTADFDSSAGVTALVSRGWLDIFVQKRDASGRLLWAKGMGGAGKDEGHLIAVDTSGSVYIAGFFTGTADFDPGPQVYNLDGGGVFIQKLDAMGNFVWVKGMQRNSSIFKSIELNDFALDDLGNIYVTGHFSGAVDFDPGAGVEIMIASGGSEMKDVFVQKLDASGDFVWAKRIGGEGYDTGESIVVDDLGAIYVAGGFSGKVDFDLGIGTLNLEAKGGTDIFIQKWDARGSLVWARSWGGNADDVGQDISIDLSGNIYMLGSFREAVDFECLTANLVLISKGFDDVFIQKINNEGHSLWAKSIGGTRVEEGSAIETDSLGNAYIVGYFINTIDFDPGVGVHEMSVVGGVSGRDVFILKLDREGRFDWARSMGGIWRDYGTDITLGRSGDIYTTGGFSEIADFDPGVGVNYLTSNGGFDIFVQKLSLIEASVPIDKSLSLQAKLYPNPSSGLFFIELPESIHAAELQIADALGRVVHQSTLSQIKNQLDFSHLLVGIYHFRIRTASGKEFGGKLVLDK